ncbi:hypothetical protein BAC2_02374 [uncultured bacterium]|nr:hypothetical protein BAC2_02374 [uncultured bacterium]
MTTSDLFKRRTKELRLALGILLIVVLAVMSIQLLELATGSPPIEGWMLSTGPLP